MGHEQWETVELECRISAVQGAVGEHDSDLTRLKKRGSAALRSHRATAHATRARDIRASFGRTHGPNGRAGRREPLSTSGRSDSHHARRGASPKVSRCGTRKRHAGRSGKYAGGSGPGNATVNMTEIPVSYARADAHPVTTTTIAADKLCKGHDFRLPIV